MSENPYQSPAAEMAAVGVRSGSRTDLRPVAMYQKGVLFCILFNIISLIVQFFIPIELRSLAITSIGLSGILSTVFVVLLAIKLYHPVLGIVYGIATLFPCLGLLMLLLINGRATNVLRENGVKVGLLGARMSDLDV